MTDANLHRAEALRRAGDYATAIAAYTTALDTASNIEAYRGWGQVYAAIDNFAAALADFSAAIELAPEDDIATYGRAIAYLTTGDEAAAIADFLASHLYARTANVCTRPPEGNGRGRVLAQLTPILKQTLI